MPAYKYNTKRGERWYVRLNYKDPITNISSETSKRGFTTKAQAKKFENEFMTNLEVRKNASVLNDRMSFADFVEMYWHHVEEGKAAITEDTKETKASIFRLHIMPFFSRFKMREITEDVVRRWQKEIMKKRTKLGSCIEFHD